MCGIRAGIKRDIRLRDPSIGFRCASDVPDPVGAIGPMRHLKPKEDLMRPYGDSSLILNPQGDQFEDGDEIDERSLFLDTGEPASLNDFLLSHELTPPPINWMTQFSGIDLAPHLRPENLQPFSGLRSFDEKIAGEYAAKADSRDGHLLADHLMVYLRPLLELSKIDCPVRIKPEPIPSLNFWMTLSGTLAM